MRPVGASLTYAYILGFFRLIIKSAEEPIGWTGPEWNYARVPLLPSIVPTPLPVDLPSPLNYPPWHSWPRGAPWLVSGSPGPDVMGLLVVVEPEVGAQFPPGFTGVGVGFQVHLLILHGVPQPLHEDVVVYRPFPSTLIFTPCSCSTCASPKLAEFRSPNIEAMG